MVYVPTGVDLVTITAIDPPGPTVVCRHGDGLAKWSSPGGWQMTKRPKRTSFTEFIGPDPYTLTVPIQFGSGFDDTVNVDPVVEVLRGIQRNQVGPRNEPAVCTVRCPLIPLNWLKFIVYDLVEKESIRNAGGGHYFAAYDMILWQWEPTDLTIATASGSSPAQVVASAPVAQSSGSAAMAAPSPVAPSTGGGAPAPASGWSYTVRSGDTLSAIAARYLGNANAWRQIASMNGLRDPGSIYPGQVLRMPGTPPANPPAAPIYGGGSPEGNGLSATTLRNT